MVVDRPLRQRPLVTPIPSPTGGHLDPGSASAEAVHRYDQSVPDNHGYDHDEPQKPTGAHEPLAVPSPRQRPCEYQHRLGRALSAVRKFWNVPDGRKQGRLKKCSSLL